MSQVFMTVFFSCIVGAIYNRVGNDQGSIINREGLLFVICSEYFHPQLAMLTCVCLG